MYLALNNLYGWAMSQSLQIGGFQWVDNFDNTDLLTVTDDSPIGYIYEVDLEYPITLHDSHDALLSPP